MFCGETIVPERLTGPQLSFNFTIRKYLLGVKLLSLSSVILEDLSVRKIAQPIMKHLSSVTGETIVLAMYSDDGAICIEKIESVNSVKTTSQVGKYFPLHAGATGLAVLMGMPIEQIKDILYKKPLEKYTDRTITEPEKIIEMILSAKEKGYIISSGTVDPGVMAVGTPLNFTQENLFMGLSITGPKYRFEKNDKFIIDELMKAKTAILQG